jgi:DNA repair exonuclease SbcCD ATPase subunit
MVFMAAAVHTAAVHIDPAWIVALGGVIGSLGWFFQWLQSRRDARLREATEPEVALARAYQSGVDGFTSLTQSLQKEIIRLQEQLDETRRALHDTRMELATVHQRQRERILPNLATNEAENRTLRGEVSRMHQRLEGLDNPPGSGVAPPED